MPELPIKLSQAVEPLVQLEEGAAKTLSQAGVPVPETGPANITKQLLQSAEASIEQLELPGAEALPQLPPLPGIAGLPGLPGIQQRTQPPSPVGEEKLPESPPPSPKRFEFQFPVEQPEKIRRYVYSWG